MMRTLTLLVWAALLPLSPAFAKDWRAQAEAEVAALDGATLTALEGARPAVARNGSHRFHEPLMATPEARAWLVQRVADPTLSVTARHGYAHALVRNLADADTLGPWADAWLELAASAADLDTRKLLVAGLAKADASTFVDGVGRALVDADAPVRALAAHTASMHPAGVELSAALRSMLSDPAAEARAQAARTLGVHSLSDATGPVATLLTDPHAEVRWQALRALERLDPDTAAQRASAMLDDRDPKVAQLAASLARR